MPVTFSARSTGDPATAWSLIARPRRWSEWAPHIRGAWGLGSPEVRDRALGAVRLLGLVPIPAQIVAKRDGRMWAWRVGPALLVHRVEAHPAGGCTVAIDMDAPRIITATYGPVVQVLLRRLASVAGELGERGHPT
jgi:hypothetical protein